mmetsp:Transcript_18391/g.42430  ORF Transcript_18391/g.42430 Transcript_18391/m.42430 type:complete len:415 (+) Transcript_18391:475-1719(+)
MRRLSGRNRRRDDDDVHVRSERSGHRDLLRGFRKPGRPVRANGRRQNQAHADRRRLVGGRVLRDQTGRPGEGQRRNRMDQGRRVRRVGEHRRELLRRRTTLPVPRRRDGLRGPRSDGRVPRGKLLDALGPNHRGRGDRGVQRSLARQLELHRHRVPETRKLLQLDPHGHPRRRPVRPHRRLLRIVLPHRQRRGGLLGRLLRVLDGVLVPDPDEPDGQPDRWPDRRRMRRRTGFDLHHRRGGESRDRRGRGGSRGNLRGDRRPHREIERSDARRGADLRATDRHRRGRRRRRSDADGLRLLPVHVLPGGIGPVRTRRAVSERTSERQRSHSRGWSGVIRYTHPPFDSRDSRVRSACIFCSRRQSHFSGSESLALCSLPARCVVRETEKGEAHVTTGVLLESSSVDASVGSKHIRW